jgi:hypothetical protein
MGRAFPSQDIQQAGDQLRFRKARPALFSANRYEVPVTSDVALARETVPLPLKFRHRSGDFTSPLACNVEANLFRHVFSMRRMWRCQIAANVAR